MSSYAVIDLEMCKVQGIKRNEFRHNHELIEIGAVLLNEKLEPADEFMTYISPQFGVIDPFIHKLTGISRADVANAPHAKEALEAFAEWLPDDTIIVSWSESDKHQIMTELEHKNISIPRLESYFETWTDCQKTFSEKMDSPKVYRLSEALIISDIPFEDGAHDALIDARNTAMLFAKMQKEPKLKLSSYYTAGESKTDSYNPFAELLAGVSFDDE